MRPVVFRALLSRGTQVVSQYGTIPTAVTMPAERPRKSRRLGPEPFMVNSFLSVVAPPDRQSLAPPGRAWWRLFWLDTGHDLVIILDWHIKNKHSCGRFLFPVRQWPADYFGHVLLTGGLFHIGPDGTARDEAAVGRLQRPVYISAQGANCTG